MRARLPRFTTRRWRALLATALGMLVALAVNAAPGRSLYADVTASRVGDLVTVIVVESTQASRTASTKTSRKGGVGFDAGFDGGATSKGYKGRFSTTADHDGGGTTSSSGILRTTVTAIVKEVLPNGYLVLEGSRELNINGEKEILTVTGVGRPQDIRQDNTILSNQLANANISYTGDGLITKQNKPSLFIRILSSILPFF